MVVNQKFIANAVGVSQKTISLYFTEQDRIAPKTCRKIEEAIRKYRYLPNSAARSITSNQFKRIACLVTQFGYENLLPQPHLMAYINGASRELARHGYALTIEPVFINRNSLQIDFPELFSTRSVDGIIGLVGSWIPEELDQRVVERGLPTVWLNRASDDPSIKSICFDEAAGATALARHLLDSGCRRVGWFGPEFESDMVQHYSSPQRYQALMKTLTEGGAECIPTFSRASEMRDDSVQRLLKYINTLDAVVSYNFHYRDTLINESIEVEVNLRRLKLAHFSSTWEYDQQSHCFIDSVRLPEAEMGTRGAQYIMARLQNQGGNEFLAPLKGQLYIGKKRMKI